MAQRWHAHYYLSKSRRCFLVGGAALASDVDIRQEELRLRYILTSSATALSTYYASQIASVSGPFFEVLDIEAASTAAAILREELVNNIGISLAGAVFSIILARCAMAFTCYMAVSEAFDALYTLMNPKISNSFIGRAAPAAMEVACALSTVIIPDVIFRAFAATGVSITFLNSSTMFAAVGATVMCCGLAQSSIHAAYNGISNAEYTVPNRSA